MNRNGNSTKRQSDTTGEFVTAEEMQRIVVDDSETMKTVGDDNESLKPGLLYGVNDVPLPHLTFLFGLQHVALSITGIISMPLIITELLCIDDSKASSEILNTFLVICGVSTIIQSFLGIRIPILQGGNGMFILPIAAMMSIEKWKCQESKGLLSNATTNYEGHIFNGSDDMNYTEVTVGVTWRDRMCEIQGSLILAGICHMMLGATGVIGLLVNYIGPLTVAPTITLIGISFVDIVNSVCDVNWGITMLTIGLIVLFSVYLTDFNPPIPTIGCKKGNRKCQIKKAPVFQLFPIIIAVGLSWIICAIITHAGGFTDDPEAKGYRARTDAQLSAIHEAQWIFLPYPGQWGMPTFSVSLFLGMLAASIASIIESVGDYHACARVCMAPPPPKHALNRGIAMEGLGTLIAGVLGAGSSVTSYSQNIGAIGLTKVASRSVLVSAGLICIVCGIIGKIGALFTMIPAPIIGAIMTVTLGMVSSVGVSTLDHVNMSQSRNQAIFGLSLMLGFMIPTWLQKNANSVNTGIGELDQCMLVLLGTPMFVGGAIGFFLDNTVRGSRKDRGIEGWRQHIFEKGHTSNKDNEADIYDLPLVSNYFKKVSWTRYVPFLPGFGRPPSKT